tara:strand:+ start:359 stop:706 length:348 start_codon:yes stop_codon:yes gene_type:complete
MKCGFVDYEQPEKIIKRKVSDAFRGNVHFVKYDGSSSCFTNTLIKVSVKKLGKDWGSKSIAIHPVCPYCNQDMNIKYISRIPRKIKIKHYSSYICSKKHRVYLSIQDDYEFGWKE